MHAHRASFRNRISGEPVMVDQVEPVVPLRPTRLVGLDAVKGALVLVMVFYHWMNYFVGLESEIYRYIRFVTPSFIFLSGFLISHIYLPRVVAGERGIQGRLVRRGLRLLGIVLVLNLAARVLGTGIVAGRLQGRESQQVAWAYLTGSSPVAFSVLVPIAYLLILSAVLLLTSRNYRNMFHLVAAVLVSAALVGEWKGFQTGYLDMLSMGIAGASAGHMTIDTLNRIVQQRTAVLGVYALHVYALAVWNAVLPMQFVSVCLNILVLYWIGDSSAHSGRSSRLLIRLGEYSLFAYIVQIFILQLLRRGFHFAGMNGAAIYVALLACVIGLVVVVALVDRAKRRAPAFAHVYAAVFA